MIAVTTYGIKNISTFCVKPYSGPGTAAKGLSKQARNDLQAKFSKLTNTFIVGAVMKLLPIGKEAKLWLSESSSGLADLMIDLSPLHVLQEGAAMQVCVASALLPT